MCLKSQSTATTWFWSPLLHMANGDQQDQAHKNGHLWQEELRDTSISVSEAHLRNGGRKTRACWVCDHETCSFSEALTFKAQDMPRLVSMAVQGSFRASLTLESIPLQ